jgi:hypothetical protein
MVALTALRSMPRFLGSHFGEDGSELIHCEADIRQSNTAARLPRCVIESHRVCLTEQRSPVRAITVLRKRLTTYLLLKRELSGFEPLKLDTVGASLGKVILCLLHKPAFSAAAENLFQTHGHFRRDAALSVYQFGQGGTRGVTPIRWTVLGCGFAAETVGQVTVKDQMLIES